MRPNLLFLFCLTSRAVFATAHEGDEHRTSWSIRKDEQIFDPSLNCEKARKALQAGFRKLLSKDPTCKSERLFLTFKKMEMIRTQSLMMRANAGVDALKECNSWLGAETKRLRSTFLYGSCRPPLASAKPTDIAAIGHIMSLPTKDKLDISRAESF
ncbi:MAG TPA: hypothetical protein VE954_15570 [Oligoflexus sp.]|uniref:hypothetical protein n=1 Tax=Oligoflexus sp. TaxID=1971216 RepID=UPI002D241DC9|nr:hypothetical protein [Oligoflexus sp.]HYX34520.1 hypothetical protein [Oligoflexus sp.]